MSEPGLERLAKRSGLECIWEDDMGGGEAKSRTLIVAGSALELVIVVSNNVVQTVSLAFPESAETVARHAEKAGKILLDNLQRAPGQTPLTKRLDRFAANFERLASLDRLSVIPGLNLFEAIGGIYDSLERLYQWDLRKLREDPALNGKSDEYLANMVMCTKHGRPLMHTRDRIGLSVDYWKQRRLIPSTSERGAGFADAEEQTWGLMVYCAPLKGEVAGQPVRASDKWISMDIEKVHGLDALQPEPVLDWLQPDNTILQPSEAEKTEAGQAGGLLLGPKFPEATFLAVFDPPLHVPVNVWETIHQRVGAIHSPDFMMLPTLDSLLLPLPQDKKPDSSDPAEPRVITQLKKMNIMMPGQAPDDQWPATTHRNRLMIYKPKSAYGKTLTEIPFSHPEQLVSILPLLRQYAFLSSLMKNSFSQSPDSAATKEASSSPSSFKATAATTTNQDDYERLMSTTKETDHDAGVDAKVDISFAAFPQPRLDVTFPFREGTATVSVVIEQNGHVHVASQNVLDESNSTSPDGQIRRPEHLGKILEMFEDIGPWVEFIRTRWAN